MAWVLQGLLTTLAPVPMLAATLVDAPDTVLGAAGTTSWVAIAITSLSALLLLIGGGVLPDRPGVGRPLSLLGLLVGLGICLPAIAQAPAAALACPEERPTWIDLLSHGGACALCGGGVALGAWAACGGAR